MTNVCIGNIEPVGEKKQKNKLRYTSFYADGDSKNLKNLKKQEKGVSKKGKLTNNMIATTTHKIFETNSSFHVK